MSKIVSHEGYDKDTGSNDIAILTLTEDAKTSPYIAPVCLPKAGAELKPGTSCRVSGEVRLLL